MMRARQFLRMYRSLGLIYMALIFFIILLLIYALFSIRTDLDRSLGSLGIAALAVALLHFNRKDIAFLRKLDAPHSLVIIIEYGLISFPIWFLILAGPHWYLSPAFLLFLGALSSFTPKISGTASGSKIRYASWVPFEFRSGIRRNLFGMILLIIIGIASLWEPYIVLGYNFLFLILMATFYQHCESREVLEAGELPTGLLLKRKFFSMVLIWALFICPINILLVFIHSPNPVLIFISMLISLIISVYFLLAKYAYYSPNEDLSSQTATTSLVLLGYFIPIFSIMALVLIIINFPKAWKRLNPYLNDFN